MPGPMKLLVTFNTDMPVDDAIEAVEQALRLSPAFQERATEVMIEQID